jgi:hypothetical protein
VGKAHVQLEEFEDAVRAYQRGKDAKVSTVTRRRA